LTKDHKCSYQSNNLAMAADITALQVFINDACKQE